MPYHYRLVKSGANKGQTVTVKPLTRQEAWIVGNVEHNSWQDATFKRYQELLKEWKDMEYWLSCDCHPEAVLYLRQSHNRISLLARSDSQYHSHEPECDFVQQSTNGKGDKKGRLPKNKKDHVFIRNLAENDGTAPHGDRNRVAGNRENSIFKLMKKLLIAAELDFIRAGARPQESEARQAISKASEHFTVGGVPMNKALFFFPQWNDMAKALRTLSYNDNAAPHVLTWWLVADYRKNDNDDWEVLVKTAPRPNAERWIPLTGTNLTFHHTRGNSNQWAVLMLIYTRKPDDTGNYFPRGYLAPVVSSNHWMVIDSEYERRVAINGRQAMNKSGINNLVMQKPLAERLETVEEEMELVIPDFIFKRYDKESVVEVMGTEEPEYIERKERLKPFMQAIGSYFEIDATTTFEDGRKKEQYYYSVCKSAIEQLRS